MIYTVVVVYINNLILILISTMLSNSVDTHKHGNKESCQLKPFLSVFVNFFVFIVLI